MDQSLRLMNPKIVAICEHTNGNIAAGTRGSEIIEFSNKKPKVVMRGHWDGELWGLCTHPKQQLFYTVGEENFLACWDIKKRQLQNSVLLEVPAKTVAMSPNAKDLAVGCKNGQVLIVDPTSLQVKQKIAEKSQEIACIRYSPDSSMLAVG